MGTHLKARLARIRNTAIVSRGLGTDSIPMLSNECMETPDFLSNWEPLAPCFWYRKIEIGLSIQDPELPLNLGVFSTRLHGVSLRIKELGFFDLETTGLSGGTGTVAFLATLGCCHVPGVFTATQYFIDDYPGEHAMILKLAEDLAAFSTIATYNGASFDVPLLKTRCIMNGIRPPQLKRHLDILPASRRLWRYALPDCSLGTIERNVLGIDRGYDVPGSAIPAIWFSFIKDRSGDIQTVLSHNVHDVSSLAMLTLALAEGIPVGNIPLADPVGLASLQERFDVELSISTLEIALQDQCARAARPLMRLYWQTGRRVDRLALIPLLPDSHYGLAMKSLYAERVEGDIRKAIALASAAIAAAPPGTAKRIETRLRRLKRLNM